MQQYTINPSILEKTSTGIIIYVLLNTLTVPSGFPQLLSTQSASSVSITIQWGQVECIHRNSEITGYTVVYFPTNYPSNHQQKMHTVDYSITITGLVPLTHYSISVAATSVNGTGPYANITSMTRSPIGKIF